MYILKNALQNLVRNSGRNLMMGIIVFVIIISVVTALMINNTAGSVINDYKTRFSSEVTFSPNMQRMQEEARRNSTGGTIRMTPPPAMKPEELLAFGQSEYLQKAIYTAETKGNSDKLKAIDADKGGGGGIMFFRGNASGNTEAESLGQQYFHRVLTNYYEDFENGLRALEEGRFPENINECIISAELLENSGLKVGDTVTVTSVLQELGGESGDMNYTDISWELMIVGVYADITDEYNNDFMQNAYTNRRNEILTTFETIADKMVEGFFGIDITAKYYLKNPDMLDAFTAEVRAKGLSDLYDVFTDAGSYERIVAPVEGLKRISITFVIIVLVFGSIILALLASIAIRERKYEIGVLRAMGMKKMKVVLGLWSETLVITAVCLIFGLGVGMMVAQPVTNVMLKQQIDAAESAQNNNSFSPQGMMTVTSVGMGRVGGGMPGRSDAEPLKELKISLDFITIIEIIAVALFLSSLAGIIATQKIIKYEPIKILMERN
ncbi:MAG: FtsX-like permease family protein [Oscillospiraceae bacterium]|nr:FtsX-like permease family protein [Oscillospiraceae bacterium]